jgi:alpha-aminoadipic semialdehyde synthase
LPYIHFLVNGVYWEAKYPRILTIDELREAKEQNMSKLLGVTDISADYQGSLEFTSEFTSIESPFLLWDQMKG